MNNLQKIYLNITAARKKYARADNVSLLAVTKNQSTDKILPLLVEGHCLFGENRVQEAHKKWPPLKTQYREVQLHLVGHLQTNKAKEAVALFDVIETLDSFKLAERLAEEENKSGRRLEYYIEINIGRELQKTGIWPEDFSVFYKKIKEYCDLNITGIMCIPPNGERPEPYFKLMRSLAQVHDIAFISMGMSADFKMAIKYGATLVRIGSALFSE